MSVINRCFNFRNITLGSQAIKGNIVHSLYFFQILFYKQSKKSITLWCNNPLNIGVLHLHVSFFSYFRVFRKISSSSNRLQTIFFHFFDFKKFSIFLFIMFKLYIEGSKFYISGFCFKIYP